MATKTYTGRDWIKFPPLRFPPDFEFLIDQDGPLLGTDVRGDFSLIEDENAECDNGSMSYTNNRAKMDAVLYTDFSKYKLAERYQADGLGPIARFMLDSRELFFLQDYEGWTYCIEMEHVGALYCFKKKFTDEELGTYFYRTSWPTIEEERKRGTIMLASNPEHPRFAEQKSVTFDTGSQETTETASQPATSKEVEVESSRVQENYPVTQQADWNTASDNPKVELDRTESLAQQTYLEKMGSIRIKASRSMTARRRNIGSSEATTASSAYPGSSLDNYLTGDTLYSEQAGTTITAKDKQEEIEEEEAKEH